MAEMNRLERWMVNRRTESRGRRVLSQLGAAFEIPAEASVLEIGAGGGGLLGLIGERFHPLRLVGTDYDPAQVAAATNYLTRRWGSLPPGVEVKRADALALPFSGDSFDYVLAMMMLHHVEGNFREYARRPQALREIWRVLRPGGMLVYSDMFRRMEIRDTLRTLGFRQEFLHEGWRSDLGMFRKPLGSSIRSPG